MIQPVTVITRLRLDAALSDPAPVRQPGTNGRPRKNGARQPTLAKRLDDPSTVWQSITVAWYGGTNYAQRFDSLPLQNTDSLPASRFLCRVCLRREKCSCPPNWGKDQHTQHSKLLAYYQQ